MVEPGQVMAAGVPAFRIAQDGDREALVAIPEVLVERVRHAEGHATLWSDPAHRYKVTLRELSPAADPATRTYGARFALADVPATLELGMTVTVTLTWPEAERVVRLPLSALFNEAGTASVFVVEAATGVLTKRPVTIKGYEARDVLIAGGLSAGEQVVTLGVHKLDVGQRVRVVADRL
jgi:RND family efflux transporter MFP subunit